MDSKKSFEDKFKVFGKRVIIPLLWFTIVLLILTTIMIIQYTLTKQLTLRSMIVAPFIFLIIYFIWILFMSVTKYKKETLMNDIERKAKWKSLSQNYKRFCIHMHILGISMSIFMLIFGVWLLIIKDPFYGWFMLILGINILILNIRLNKKKNKPFYITKK